MLHALPSTSFGLLLMAARMASSCCCCCWSTVSARPERAPWDDSMASSCCWTAALRLLLLELCVVKELKTSGQGRYACLNTGQIVGQLGHRPAPFPDLWSHQVRGLCGYVTNWSQQRTADEQRWRQHGDRGRPRRHCGGADVREQTVAQASGGVGSYMHLHCSLELIEGRAMDTPGRRTAQRHCLL